MSVYLALGELRLDLWPCLALSGIAEQVHDYRAFGDCLVNLEQIRAWDPAILLSLFPRATVFPHADDYIEAIVSQVETLAVSLGAVTNDR